jgi:hypothetical protein
MVPQAASSIQPVPDPGHPLFGAEHRGREQAASPKASLPSVDADARVRRPEVDSLLEQSRHVEGNRREALFALYMAPWTPQAYGRSGHLITRQADVCVRWAA